MPPNPPPRLIYESAIPPESIGVADSRLGKRSADDVLRNAFNRPSEAAVAEELLTISITALNEYSGENPMFQEYRRNFIPESATTLPEAYRDVRNKNSVQTGLGTGLGTAYSPTIASPGVAEGVSPTNLRSVSGNSSAVLVEATGATGPNPLYNPSNEAHTNRSSEGEIINVGKVRRFKLGIVSSTTTTLDENSNRGQFPLQPVGRASTG